MPVLRCKLAGSVQVLLAGLVHGALQAQHGLVDLAQAGGAVQGIQQRPGQLHHFGEDGQHGGEGIGRIVIIVDDLLHGLFDGGAGGRGESRGQRAAFGSQPGSCNRLSGTAALGVEHHQGLFVQPYRGISHKLRSVITFSEHLVRLPLQGILAGLQRGQRAAASYKIHLLDLPFLHHLHQLLNLAVHQTHLFLVHYDLLPNY